MIYIKLQRYVLAEIFVLIMIKTMYIVHFCGSQWECLLSITYACERSTSLLNSHVRYSRIDVPTRCRHSLCRLRTRLHSLNFLTLQLDSCLVCHPHPLLLLSNHLWSSGYRKSTIFTHSSVIRRIALLLEMTPWLNSVIEDLMKDV